MNICRIYPPLILVDLAILCMVDLDVWDLTNVVSAPMECDSNKDSVQSNFCVLCRVCKEMSCEESKTIVIFADIPHRS